MQILIYIQDMKKIKYFISIFLITSASCNSFYTSVAESIVSYTSISLIVPAKMASVAVLSVNYKDSLGYWPSSLDSLNAFYIKNTGDSLEIDSVYNPLSFNINDFESMEFFDLRNDLKINFKTSYWENEMDSLSKSKGLHYLKAEGLVLISSLSISSDTLLFEIDHTDINFFDSKKHEIGSGKIQKQTLSILVEKS